MAALKDDQPQDEEFFAAVNTLVLLAVVLVCVLISYQLKKHRFYYLPSSGGSLIVGILVGGVCLIIYPEKKERDFLSFQPEIFFFVLLPPIIFEAGYTLKKKRFFNNFSTILMYAILGTLVSTFVVGFLTFAVASAGWVKLDPTNPLESLLFGALISAVDPVATLSIIGAPEINAEPLLYSLVFGESVLNDAVAIVLFNSFKSFINEESFTGGSIGLVILQFVGISVGSVVVGVLFGMLCSAIFKHSNLREHPSEELVLLLLFPYASYAFAETIKVSGIMSLFFTGIIMAHYNWHNLSLSSQTSSKYAFKSFAEITETFVFAYVGITTVAGEYARWDPGFIVLSIIFCLIGRALNIFPFSYFANLRRKRKIGMNMQIVMWFAGLRGAIAVSLALNMPTANKELVITTTLAIVWFTTLVCGGLTEPMLGWLHMKRPRVLSDAHDLDRSDSSTRLRGDSTSGTHISTEVIDTELKSVGKASGFHKFWKDLDRKYLKPHLGGKESNRTAREFTRATSDWALPPGVDHHDDHDDHGHAGLDEYSAPTLAVRKGEDDE